MRILFLALDIDLVHQRGDTIHAVELARALDLMGHDVTLVVGANGSARKLLPPHVDVHVARGSNWRVVRAIRELAPKVRAEVVYERRFSPKIGTAVRALVGAPLVLEVNGILREELSHGGGSVLKPRLVKDRIRAELLRRVDRIVAVTSSIGEDLVQTYGVDPSRIRVVGNGVDTERFVPRDKESACREAGLPQRPRIVFVGNIAGWRDFGVVLQSLPPIRKSISDVELLVVGAGPDEHRVRSQARELGLGTAVRFAGLVPYERVPSLIAASDLGLLPEKPREVEISPLKLFEYFACARPVLASRVRGLEFVDHYGLGKLYEAGNSGELAALAQDILLDSTCRAEMGNRARSFVEHERSWSAVAARVAGVLGEVIHG